MQPAEPTSDIPCVRCGYSLRGHDESARCPECGLPAYWSLRAPQRLSEFPAGWVASMAAATRMLALGYGAAFVIGLLAGAGIIPETLIIPASLFAATSVLLLVGMWMLSPHSGHRNEPPATINRWLLRITPLGLIIASVAAIALVVDYAPHYKTMLRYGFLIAAAAPVATFFRLRSVARLIADPALAEHCAIVAWGSLITAVATIALILLMLGLGIDGYMNHKPDMPILILMFIAAVAILLFLLWAAFIMACCVIDFARAARIAKARWNADQPTPNPPAQ